MQSKAALFKNHISLLALGENNFPKVMLISRDYLSVWGPNLRF